ncbi:MAG: hypothetical protein Kow0029_26450 [Candidatus Rifleibacteriota bacterium]
MKFGLKATIVLLSIFSACLVRAERLIESKVFLNQKVEVFGLAGTPWEDSFAFEEERSRAWMDALHHAYEAILNLPLMEGKLVRQALQTNPALKERLGMILLSAPRTFYQPDTAGIVRCKLEVPLSGKLSLRSALYLAALRPQSQQPVSFLASWTSALKDRQLPEPGFKRLIIDARDYYFEPSLFPRIFDNSGNLLFQEAMIPRPERFSRPAIRFAVEVKRACANLKDDQIMIARASVNELSSCDLTLAEPDATIVAGFCRLITLQPDKEREIVVLFDPEKTAPVGLIERSKTEKTATRAEK